MMNKQYIDEYGVIFSADRTSLIGVDISVFTAKEYHVPDGTLKIEANAFWCCNSLEKLYIPDSVLSVDGSMCECAKNLKYARLSKHFLHPDIAMFCGCESLEEVVLPEGIQYIGENMFCGCKSLKSIYLPSSVRYLCGDTFCGSGIEEIVLPEGLESIGCDAFVNCRALKRLTVPQSVKEIGGWFVQGHANFEGVECLSPHFRVEAECLISNDDDSLIACWTKDKVFHVPQSVRNISSICNDQIESLVIDYPIDHIRYDALCANPNLKEVIYNAEVKKK